METASAKAVSASVRTIAPTVGSCSIRSSWVMAASTSRATAVRPARAPSWWRCATVSRTPERPRNRVQVALAPLFGVQRDLGQRAQDLPDRRGERVADGEFDDRHGCRVGHATSQATHEVERLQLGLLEAGVRCLLCARGNGCQLARVPALGLPTEVRQTRVVAGDAVERAGSRGRRRGPTSGARRRVRLRTSGEATAGRRARQPGDQGRRPLADSSRRPCSCPRGVDCSASATAFRDRSGESAPLRHGPASADDVVRAPTGWPSGAPRLDRCCGHR